jgi:Phytanoyl-CoA dioxygenase (PhyH)
MNPIFVDAARQQEFVRDGFTIVRLFSDEEVSALETELAAFHRGGFARNSDAFSDPYHASFYDEDKDYRRRAYAFARKTMVERAAKVIQGYRMIAGGFVVKDAGDGAVALHRDWTLTEDPRQISVNFWCPLVDTDDVNGTLRIVVGSHKLVPNVETAHVTPYFGPYHHTLKEMSVAVRVKAGEALVFDSGALHWSDANRSDASRTAILSTWIPEHCRTVFYALDRATGGSRFELFDMEEDGLIEHTPIQLAQRDFDRTSLGFVPNRNRAIPYEEFVRRLAKGDTIRRDLFTAQPARPGALARLRDLMFARD